MLYMEVVKRVNSNSYHKEEHFLIFLSLYIYLKLWMFTKLIVVIIS